MIRRPPRSTLSSSSAASDVYKRQVPAPASAMPEAAVNRTAVNPSASIVSFMMPGEMEVISDSCIKHFGQKLVPGWLRVTNNRLLWTRQQDAFDKETDSAVALPSVDRLVPLYRAGHGDDGEDREVTAVYTKFNARPSVILSLPKHTALQLIQDFTKLGYGNNFVFNSFEAAAEGQAEQAEQAEHDGWLSRLCNTQLDDFRRQGVTNLNSAWRECHANRGFVLCSSYPEAFFVPKAMEDQEIVEVAKFRSSGRLPVLCWKNKHGFASITRCSQPMIGAFSKECASDQKLLLEIGATNVIDDTLHIFDCRPKVNARANMVAGKGYERGEQYSHITLEFLDIDNIHVMRDSLSKFLQVLEADFSSREIKKGYLQSVEDSMWPHHIKMVLSGAYQVCQKVTDPVEQSSVLVHCSDGWDRTPQLTALAMLMADPHYRTVEGQIGLIEQQWTGYGHRFSTRVGNACSESAALGIKFKPDQISPVFLQYIECIWQLMMQNPTAFEFNAYFLVTVLERLTNGRYGTFMFSTEKERADTQAATRTASVWTEVFQNIAEYKNPLYVQQESSIHRIEPDLSRIRVWEGFYCRGAELFDPRDGYMCVERALNRHFFSSLSTIEQQISHSRQALDGSAPLLNVTLAHLSRVDAAPGETEQVVTQDGPHAQVQVSL
eukprot:TRINITY_DN5671_c0_g1_i4.p1 TRINITY_DN5671_c0_g1~~TRINITY_DN5671_c0_g1_i4.p1  ORF type:complete len:663 (-),score=146.19 TRINITY_DN5671_c0_g1_i4:342-2330(-)